MRMPPCMGRKVADKVAAWLVLLAVASGIQPVRLPWLKGARPPGAANCSSGCAARAARPTSEAPASRTRPFAPLVRHARGSTTWGHMQACACLCVNPVPAGDIRRRGGAQGHCLHQEADARHPHRNARPLLRHHDPGQGKRGLGWCMHALGVARGCCCRRMPHGGIPQRNRISTLYAIAQLAPRPAMAPACHVQVPCRLALALREPTPPAPCWHSPAHKPPINTACLGA